VHRLGFSVKYERVPLALLLKLVCVIGFTAFKVSFTTALRRFVQARTSILGRIDGVPRRFIKLDLRTRPWPAPIGSDENLPFTPWSATMCSIGCIDHVVWPEAA